jgi:hypothetical protein
MTATSIFFAVMQARRYAVTNMHSVSRNWDDLPPLASDEELVAWGKELNAPTAYAPVEFDADAETDQRTSRPDRPLVATRITSSMSTEELFLDISDRANQAYARLRRRVIVRP